MYDLPSMLVLGFVIGLTGALAPGPTLVATIHASLTGNWATGLKISLGHMVVEAVIFLLIVLGLTTVARPYAALIAVVGGIALVVFGVLTIAGSRSASLETTADGAVTNPYLAGLLTSAANPYFWIWWLSVGSAMVIASLSGGLVLAAVFMIGHWCADTGWYTSCPPVYHGAGRSFRPQHTIGSWQYAVYFSSSLASIFFRGYSSLR